MDYGLKTEESNSTPKLTLSKLPFCKQREEPPWHMQTPPLRPSVSIPFHWEEAPGKPRAVVEMGALPLPTPPYSKWKAGPRGVELPSPSPTSVLEGPYVGRSLSLSCTFSFRKGVAAEGSGRWGREREREEKCGYAKTLGDIFRSEDRYNRDVKKMRRRRRSFFSLSTTLSSKYLWADVYASLKQAVPWRRSS